MSETDKTPRPGRARQWLLVGSLAVNLMVAGVVLGGFLAGGHGEDRRSGGGVEHALRDIGNLPFVAALSREDRAALAESLGGRREALRDNRERLRVRFEEVLALLRAEPFQPEDLRALLAEQRATLSERQQLGEELLIARLSQMTPDERATYAERLDKSLRRGPRGAPRP